MRTIIQQCDRCGESRSYVDGQQPKLRLGRPRAVVYAEIGSSCFSADLRLPPYDEWCARCRKALQVVMRQRFEDFMASKQEAWEVEEFDLNGEERS